VSSHSSPEVLSAIEEFAIPGKCIGLEPYERGHIHDTYISAWKRGESVRRYLHQRINDKVFHDIPALMHNIEFVTRHLSMKGPAEPDSDGLRTLQLVPTKLGRSFLVAPSGPWRTYRYVEGTRSFDRCESTEQAFAAARAFGDFQAELSDLDVQELRETIPGFFDPAHRMRQFRDALESDPRGRAVSVQSEIRFVLDREPMTRVIEDHMNAGRIPRRIVHGDTKLNNVLFDSATGHAVCVVDLDTCMPAWSLYDFGDLVRFTAATSAEDETDLSLAGTDPRVYQALVDGYLESAQHFLAPDELELMPFSGRLVTFMLGVRFLTDYLAGDVYFKTSHPDHNLDRARVQLQMVHGMERMQV
jgi:Ser/Thr protein kinase RdoA (MazF antagonist)